MIPGVTDRDYYTNSFHVPVYYPISAFEKIAREAPYHELTNGGHISYIELDGDPTQNLEAFEAVVRAMKEAGVGYGSVNHPVDRDPVCGYTGIIGEVCPALRPPRGEGVPLSKLQKLGLYKIQQHYDRLSRRPCRSRPTVSRIFENRQKVTGKGAFYHGN